ncbi:ATP-binding protein [Pseudorhodoferax sp.]|uniref:ATP-binding protein n=1 Tax=Pseudorhodoferax sp. TaxID=1993553 RepID=UPI0039E50E60
MDAQTIAPARPQLRSVAAVLLLEALILAAVGWGLWMLRQQSLDGEMRRLASLAAALSAQADAALDVADATLRATRGELAGGLIVPGSAGAQAVLHARMAALPQFRALAVLDTAGRVVASSWDGPLLAAPLAGHGEVRAPQQGAAPGLFVGSPFTSRLDGQPLVGVSMDWRAADGRWQGTVVLLADPEFLDGDFRRIAPTADTSLAIYRRDHALVSDGPGDGSADLLPAAVSAALWDAPAPRVERLPDGRERLVAAQPLHRYPLMVVVGRDLRAALADWAEQAWLVAAFAASALTVTLFLLARNLREQRLRLAAQALLAAEQQRAARERRLEALGTLAGGVAHDFNNILASVIGYGELARSAAPDGSDQARQLDQVLQAGQRGRALVERVLSFSRGAMHVPRRFLLQPVVQEVLEMLQPTLPAGVALAPALHAPAAVVAGDPTLVYEAAMNLCTNGVQAMPQGGTLGVALDEEDVAAPRALYESWLAAGRYARLRVQDAGAGIPPEVMDRLFEPFFTTKGPRQGTGLGLAVVHGVMAELGGGIDVRSAPGQGACFTLYFPCVDAPPDAGAQGDAAADDDGLPFGEGQAVLVVDDEPALVTLAEEMLASLGYEPFGLSSSTEALERVRREPARFDLVLTDERMPGLAGTALAEALRRIRPGLPVVLASGYGGPDLEQRAAAAGIRVLLKKPLVRAELARAVAQALLQAQGPGGAG